MTKITVANKDKNRLAKSGVILVWVMLAVVILIMTISAIKFPSGGSKLNMAVASDFNEGWYLINDDGTRTPVSLKSKVENEADKPLKIVKTIPPLEDNMSVLVMTHQQTLRAIINGTEIYSGYIDVTKYSGHSPGSFWQIFSLPDNSEGSELMLELTSVHKQYAGRFPTVTIGTRSAILDYVTRSSVSYLIFALIIFSIGVMLLGQHFTYNKIAGTDQRLLYLAMFTFTTAIWIFMYSGISQLFTDNHFINAWGEYPIFMFMPVPMFLFCESTFKSKLLKYIYPFIWLFSINIVLMTFLHFAGIADYCQTLFITHIIMVGAIGWLLIVTLIEILVYKNLGARRFLALTGILMLFTTAEIINYYLRFIGTLFLFPLGMVVYVVLLGISTIKNFRELQKNEVEVEYYRQLAFEDMLTAGNNRAAYMRDMENISKEEPKKDLRIIMFDLNDLKYINDTFGHHAGDDALVRTYNCMNSAFGDKGTCYRIGGDEFACILSPCIEMAFEKMCKDFSNTVKTNDEKTEYPFAVAMGCAVYDGLEKLDAEELAKKADKMLYHEKRLMKKKSEEYLD